MFLEIKKVKKISTKKLTKDLINKYSIFNGEKYLYSVILQNYFVFIPAKNTLNVLVGLLK